MSFGDFRKVKGVYPKIAVGVVKVVSHIIVLKYPYKMTSISRGETNVRKLPL